MGRKARERLYVTFYIFTSKEKDRGRKEKKGKTRKRGREERKRRKRRGREANPSLQITVLATPL